LKEGDIIGLDSKNIIAKGEDVSGVTEDVVEKLINENIMSITLFYGQDVQKAEAELLAEKISSKHPDIEVDFHYGGQPLYYYMISLE
jgi:dihydroxyacetone kinase-like predicted kinase